MKGRGLLAMGVEVQLVDAATRVDASTGAARGHIRLALSLCNGNGVCKVIYAVRLIRRDERHPMTGPPACLGRSIYYRTSKAAGILICKCNTQRDLHFFAQNTCHTP